MKKKVDFRLTISMVSLFIGILVVILGNGLSYCIAIGMILIAASCFVFSGYQSGKLTEQIDYIQTELDNFENDDSPYDPNTSYTRTELREMMEAVRSLKRQRRKSRIIYNTFATVLVIVAIFAF